MWQYRAYVMDSVSSDQAIITCHRHSSMHSYNTIFMHYAYIAYHTIPILSPSFLYHPYIPSFSKEFSFTFLFSFFIYSVMTVAIDSYDSYDMYVYTCV